MLVVVTINCDRTLGSIRETVRHYSEYGYRVDFLSRDPTRHLNLGVVVTEIDTRWREDNLHRVGL